MIGRPKVPLVLTTPEQQALDSLAHRARTAPCTAVHTWFMRFPIDVLFVSKGGVIRKVRNAVHPWRFAIAWRAYAVIELPAGAAGDCRPGDLVEVVPNGDPRSRS